MTVASCDTARLLVLPFSSFHSLFSSNTPVKGDVNHVCWHANRSEPRGNFINRLIDG